MNSFRSVREITFTDNVEVNALTAYNIIQASDQIFFQMDLLQILKEFKMMS